MGGGGGETRARGGSGAGGGGGGGGGGDGGGGGGGGGSSSSNIILVAVTVAVVVVVLRVWIARVALCNAVECVLTKFEEYSAQPTNSIEKYHIPLRAINNAFRFTSNRSIFLEACGGGVGF
ncbi:hypothetical protein M0804_003642 [Polistes exclamans]|nr:hypothetical protein M0804_003642 [Polistes exclamans]